MFEFSHKIAGIHFLTRLNTKIPKIDGKVFEPFVISKKISPDIIQNIFKLNENDSIKIKKLLQRINKKKGNIKENLSSCLSVIDDLEINSKINKSNTRKIIDHNGFFRDFNFSTNTLTILIYRDKIEYQKDLYKSEYFIAANFRIIFSSFLTSFNSIMLHCSGLVINKRAAIFFAPNFGGKTTTVILSKNRFPILNDDQIIFKKEDGEIFAHSTPFGARNSGPIKSKVKGIFFLKKSSSFKIEHISPLDIIECLWSEHLRYTYFLSSENKKIAFNILFDILHQAPVYTLYFNKDFIDWKAIEKAMD